MNQGAQPISAQPTHPPTHLHQVAALLVRRHGLLQLPLGLHRCRAELLQLLPALLLSPAALLTPPPPPLLHPAQGLWQQRLPLLLQVMQPPLLLHHRRRCLDKRGRQVLPHCTHANALKRQC